MGLVYLTVSMDQCLYVLFWVSASVFLIPLLAATQGGSDQAWFWWRFLFVKGVFISLYACLVCGGFLQGQRHNASVLTLPLDAHPEEANPAK